MIHRITALQLRDIGTSFSDIGLIMEISNSDARKLYTSGKYFKKIGRL
jgi:hypothetical protein